MRLSIAIAACLLLSLPSAADEGGRLSLGSDRFEAGDSVVHGETGADNLFLAGETVRQGAPISGSGHLAGRRVAIDAAVGGSLYAAGMDVALTAEVAGDATLAGYSVTVTAPVGGNLRAFAARLRLDAPVAGTALIAADAVTLNAPVVGDVVLVADRLVFGPEARIDGSLRLYSDRADRLELPERVIAPERVSRHPRADWRRIERPGPSLLGLIGGFLAGVLLVAAVAALIAAVAPGPLAEMRRRILARPFGTLGWGFLTLSAVIGAGLVLALTLVGIFLVPAALALAVIGGFFGYVVGAYSFGAGLLIAFGGGEPDSLGRRALAALIGAGLAGMLALIPLAGWLFILALVLTGVGAITLRVFRPAFFAAET